MTTSKLLLSLLLLSSATTTRAEQLNSTNTTIIVDAIYILEGGSTTRYPYGIRSIKTSNPRQVCINTVRNNYHRWQVDSQDKDYFTFLADKYCPAKADRQGNINWKKNIKLLTRGLIID
jgi:hypothetical protein